MSVLYVCHGHPAQARGGGELAAWRLFEHFSAEYGPERCGFLAAARRPEDLPPGCQLLELAPRQWLMRPSSNAVIHDTAVSLRPGGPLQQALAPLQPRLIHLHHYLHVGADLVQALRRWFPQAAVLLTLHDYWGPCAYEGRLLRRDGVLCEGGDPEACNTCLGGAQRDQLAIRAQRVRRLFAAVDHCLAPSYFLKQRYLAWGLDPHRISVVENLPAPWPTVRIPPDRDGAGHGLRLGYFGQVNPWKGLDLILEAVALARQRGAVLRLEVHGLDAQTLAEGAARGDRFYGICAAWLQQLGPHGVHLAGVYEPEALSARMVGLDALVMGSIWYENSPMVIQEAYRHGLPVLAPRLGGMAEKVRHGACGLLFPPGDVQALAVMLLDLAQDPGLQRHLAAGVQQVARRLDSPALQHAQLYNRWLRRWLPLSSEGEVHEQTHTAAAGG